MKKIITLSLAIISFTANAENDSAETTQKMDGPIQKVKQVFDVKALYAGFGIGLNRVDGPFKGSQSETATGLQGFAGYHLGKIEQVSSAIEVGYSRTEDFVSGVNSDVSGLWFAGLVKTPVPDADPRLQVLAKAGMDLGDDDGPFLGLGAEFQFNPVLSLRGEYLNKDSLTSYQLNVIVDF